VVKLSGIAVAVGIGVGAVPVKEITDPLPVVGRTILVVDDALSVLLIILPVAVVVEGVLVEEVLALPCPDALLEPSGVNLLVGVGVGAFSMNLVTVPHTNVGGAVFVKNGTFPVFAALFPTAIVVEEVFIEEILSLSVPESVLEGSGVGSPIRVGVGAFAVRLVLVPHASVGGAVIKFAGAFSVPQSVLPVALVPRLVVPKQCAFSIENELSLPAGFHCTFIALALCLVDVQRHHTLWNSHLPTSLEQRTAVFAMQGSCSVIGSIPKAAFVLQDAAGPVALAGTVVLAVSEVAFVNRTAVASEQDALSVEHHTAVTLKPDWPLVVSLVSGIGVNGHLALGLSQMPFPLEVGSSSLPKEGAFAVILSFGEQSLVLWSSVFPEERAFALVLVFGKFALVAHSSVVPAFLPGTMLMPVLELTCVGDFACGCEKNPLSVEAVALKLPDVVFLAVGVEIERGVGRDADFSEFDMLLESRVVPVFFQVGFPDDDRILA